MVRKKVQTSQLKLTYPLLPARDIVFFPNMVLPLSIGRTQSIEAVEKAMLSDRMIFICTQKDYNLESIDKDDLYEVGTVAEIIQIMRLPNGYIKILLEGKKRAVMRDFIQKDDKYISVEVFEMPDEDTKNLNKEIQAKIKTIVDLFQEYANFTKKIPLELSQIILNIDEPNKLIDIIAGYLSIKNVDKQNLLEIFDIEERLEKLASILVKENELLNIEQKIKIRMKNQIEKSQKEYYLNEQMKAIQKELHKKDENLEEIEILKAKIKKTKMSKEAKEAANKELSRLEKMSLYSAEATVSRTYIEWLVDMPWDVMTKDNLDISNARNILEKDHYGLHKVKERILEYLSVCKLTEKNKGPILCFVGPPGVGKTSIAKSIADAMDRKFVRISLGGVHDEAEIRGHRRTYIGSLPGRIIQSIKKAGSKNPVFLLDEIDKLGSDFKGDPASALLEVLDSEQNMTFADHYLEVDFDLSNVMFITTANNMYNIPMPLLDRMELVEFSGYTMMEKKNIAKKYLVPKQIENMGLKSKDIAFVDEGIEEIIKKYTSESGVRNLNREIANVCRKVAKKKAENELNEKEIINKKNIDEFLGIPKNLDDIFSKNEIGIATGLAWTEVGGEILNIEVLKMKNKGGLVLTLTGKLGEVMKESAQTGLSFLRANSKKFGIDEKNFNDTEIHIHVPEGAIPKDGPSAGITITTALLSALTKKKVKSGIAMTGEITLTGKVLPIGGLKEKVLAAYRCGIKKVLIPEHNKKDLRDIPKEVLDKIEIFPVKTFNEVIEQAISKN
jgi:ATP-dependent Lon protease